MENCPHLDSTERPSGAMASEHPAATLLVFTLGAGRESRRRRLLPLAHQAIEDRLHQACLDTALAAGRDAGLRLEVSSPLDLALPDDVDRRHQRGPDFGSRLKHAFDRTFIEQGGPVILVGSDVPDLEAHHLSHTLEILGENPDKVVIGPSPDGGFYLLAAARPLGAALSKVHWRCRRTLHSLKRALHKQGRKVVLLPSLADLDRRADLERWLASSRVADSGKIWQESFWRRLIDSLGEILAGLRRFWLPGSKLVFWNRQPRAHRLRGPPLLA